MRFSLVVLVALGVSACVDVNDTEVNARPAAVTSKDRGYIQSAIVDSLKDPGSAQLRNVAAFDLSNGQGRAICGEINGKNSFGAYIGYKPFYLRIRDGALASRFVGSGAKYDLDGQMAIEACSLAATGRMKVKA
ncbi:hypothetical protein DRW48_10495 [Paracoccus suum]|uniref:Uncharacterized protein n=1 Tax=Paracoccus suum TaxID=2259340 RepID=A0A344PL08_9RHOB|nr:hypothetical protein [Paracoccus suum]AXC50063.1 hypothetical protein DRW48_10495 [Paracoccus suum]